LELKLDNYQNEDIILNGNGKIISNANELLNYKDKTMEIIWNNVIVKVKIESMKTFI